MNTKHNLLSDAIRFGLAAGAVGLFGIAPNAMAQSSGDQEAATLDRIEVTGSRLRRVETETASPVYTIDRQAIEATGALTVGDFLQDAPSIAGAATNPQVNNGGGTGESYISLRGLGQDRTLILLNGRRLVSQDVNAIPINMIERVDVLKEGASVIYGSDAVGGVVNFITRRDFDGAEISADYGVSSEDDGERQSVSASMGMTSDRGNIMFGLNWNKFESVDAKDRDFSKDALYLYSGEVFPGGSSRTPTGRIFLEGAAAALRDQFGGCTSLTRKAGSAGTSLSDYRCFTGDDFYNYQSAGNLLLTPQERTNLFTAGNYQLTDEIEAYFEVFHNRTTSGFQIAPLPFDARADGVVLSKDSMYNPFGVDFGGADGVNPRFMLRLEALGNRRSENDTTTDQLNFGLRSNIGDTTWRWDANVSWGKIDRTSRTYGYLYQPAIAAALGPSEMRNGVPVCVDAPGGNVIAGCTPVNFFNLNDPAQLAALGKLAASYGTTLEQDHKSFGVNFDGEIFETNAGAALLAVGAEYRELELMGDVDFLAQAQGPDFLNCYLAQETCTNATNGDYDVKEYYAEAFIPLLSGAQWAESLNLNFGVRHSDYSNFGTTTNMAAKLEWRPMDNMLVRASWAEVFRAPTITDLFQPATANAPTFTDPCVGITTPVGQNPNLDKVCQFVPRDGSFAQANGQINGLLQGNPDLQPEEGSVFTWGVVYDPDWLPNLSMAMDIWRYKLTNTIEQLDVNTIATQCLTTGAAQFCDLITRFPDGQVQVIDQPTSNLGRIDTKGVDVGFKYRLDDTAIGSFRFSLDTTYIAEFDRTPDVNFPGVRLDNAGTFSRQDGNYSRFRSIGSIRWSYGAFDAMYTARYIGGFRLGSPKPGGDSADGAIPNVVVDYGSNTYHNLVFGYNYEPWASRVELGVDNVGDKQPPILFQNNVINANTDVSTFDTIGRYYWVRFSKKF